MSWFQLPSMPEPGCMSMAEGHTRSLLALSSSPTSPISGSTASIRAWPPAHHPAGGRRYADGVIDARCSRIICVCEDHRLPGREALNTIVAIDLDGEVEMQVLAKGYDFYSSPRISPDGRRLAWLAWNHPQMPWDGTGLWTGELEKDGSLGAVERVAGGSEESIFQPQWSPDGVLHFVSDRTGWSNLYCWQDGHALALTDIQAELSRPQWRFGFSTYAFLTPDRIICTYAQDGIWKLARLDTSCLKIDPIKTPFTEISYLEACRDHALFIAGSPDLATSVVKLDLSSGEIEVLRRSGGWMSTGDTSPGRRR